jgi:hypothetical protein
MAWGYRFAVLGPFRVPIRTVRNRRIVDFDSAANAVFDAAEEQCRIKLGITGIRRAIGCYVFALKPSKTLRFWPYYVGQSCRQTLAQRVFQSTDKPTLYKEIVNEYRRAAAYFYLLPLLTEGARFARVGTNQQLINKAEYALIGMALNANPDLWNIKHRMQMESFSIDGTPQTERTRDSAPAASFRRMLGFADYPKSAQRRGKFRPDLQDPEDLPDAPALEQSPSS